MCKCGSRRKIGSAPFVMILAKELERNIKRTLSGLASSPIFLETSEQFCAVPAKSWHQFNFLGFIPFNSLIDKRWAERCECVPEKGSWSVQIFWEGDGYDANGNLAGTIRDTNSIYYTSKQPRGAAVVPVPLSGNQLSYRVLTMPPGENPLFIGELIERTTALFQLRVLGIKIRFLASGCFPSPPPPTPPLGNYPGIPSSPSIVPPPDAFIPPETLVKPRPVKPPPPRKPTPKDDCCDCC